MGPGQPSAAAEHINMQPGRMLEVKENALCQVEMYIFRTVQQQQLCLIKFVTEATDLVRNNNIL